MKSLIWCIGLVLALSFPALAWPSSAATKQEIELLLERLSSSSCRFNRNGSWYEASNAATHLRDKYEYLLERGQVPTAEAFIERAASQSSMSGKPYRVRCPGQPEMPSAEWLRAQLKSLREESSRAAPQR